MKTCAIWLIVCCCLAPAYCSVCGIPYADNYMPPDWDTFTAPAEGQSYVDPVFGCTIKRLTDASTDETAWDGTYVGFMNYGATFSPINAIDNMLFIYSDDGNVRIKGMDASTVVSVNDMPNMNAGHPVWDAANGNIFYYVLNNNLYAGTVTGSSVASTLLHTFDEYPQGVVFPDGVDLSEDGDHIGLVGKNANNTLDVFVWSLGQQNKTSVYTTTCTMSGGTIIYSSQPGCVFGVQLTADNLLTITFNDDGSGAEEGLRLWSGSALVAMDNQRTPYDTGYDGSGTSVFISNDNWDTMPSLTSGCGYVWGISLRRVSDLEATYCFLGQEPDYHISYRGNASQPWMVLSFFDGRSSGPEFYSSDTAHYQPPDSNNWKLWEDEIVALNVNGGVYGVAHARSRSEEPYHDSYWAQPRASISRDGRFIVFNSNMAFAAGCPTNMHVQGECPDVYVLQLQQ